MPARRWFGVIGSLLLAATAPVAAPAAQAANPTPCSIYSCDRTEPTTTANGEGDLCSAGATTVAHRSAFGGLLEQRWGPNCGTNWTRFTPENSDRYGIYVVNEKDGEVAGAGNTSQPFYFSGYQVTAWTSQVYADHMPAASCVFDVTTNSTDLCVYSS